MVLCVVRVCEFNVAGLDHLWQIKQKLKLKQKLTSERIYHRMTHRYYQSFWHNLSHKWHIHINKDSCFTDLHRSLSAQLICKWILLLRSHCTFTLQCSQPLSYISLLTAYQKLYPQIYIFFARCRTSYSRIISCSHR